MQDINKRDFLCKFDGGSRMDYNVYPTMKKKTSKSAQQTEPILSYS
jgi:hypothetical protein